MSKDYSIAEARKRLPTLVKRAESGEAIELTRRGEPVAVLISREQYARLSGERRPNLAEAIKAFRQSHDLEALDGESAFSGLRDESVGREPSL